jgi:hypothetical protein
MTLRLDGTRGKCVTNNFPPVVFSKEIIDVISPTQKMQIKEGKSTHISHSSACLPIFV